ncbi:MAG: hypothetical protein ACRD2H_07335 [Terriglobales bacterium]
MSAPKTPAELMAIAKRKVAEYRVGRAAAPAKRAALAVVVAADAVAKRDSTAWWAAYNVAWE